VGLLGGELLIGGSRLKDNGRCLWWIILLALVHAGSAGRVQARASLVLQADPGPWVPGKHHDTCVIDSSGHRAEDFPPSSENPTKEVFSLRMMTVNVTSWHSVKPLLLKTNANLIFVQEHKNEWV